MNFLLGIVQSLIASFIFSLYKTENKTASKLLFEKRAKIFHSEISTNLIHKIIPLLAPSVAEKLHRENLMNKKVIFPYIDLYSQSDLTISRNLQTNINKFPVNEKFIAWLRDELGKRLTNDPTFSLNSISTKNELSLSVGNYFTTLSTSDIHYFNVTTHPIRINKRT